jgi:hypothetical protein
MRLVSGKPSRVRCYGRSRHGLLLFGRPLQGGFPRYFLPVFTSPADSITSERRLRSNGREAHPALCEEDYEILFPFIAFTICTGGDRLLQLPYMIYLLCAKVKGRKQSNPTNTHSLSVRTYKQPWVRAFACTSRGREWQATPPGSKAGRPHNGDGRPLQAQLSTQSLNWLLSR